MEEATAPLDAVLFLVHAIDWLEVPDREGQTALQAFFDGQLGDPIETARGRAEISTERPDGARFAEWIRDVVERTGTDRARCVLDGAARNGWQEVRLWVFGCAGMSDKVSRR